MGYLLFKTLCNALIVTAASEAGKRHVLVGSLIASVPLVSVLSMVWLYLETKDTERIAQFAYDVLWLLPPSLPLFLLLPWLLSRGWGFFPGLGIALLGTVAAYGVTVWLLSL